METEYVLAKARETTNPTGRTPVDPVRTHELRAAGQQAIGAYTAAGFGVTGLICLVVGFEIAASRRTANEHTERVIAALRTLEPKELNKA